MRIALVVGLVSAVACGGSAPTSPDANTPAPAVVKLGPQLLVIEHHPSTPFCGIPAGAGGTLIVTQLTLQWSGSEWVGTPPSASAGTMEVHLRPSGTTTAALAAVTGAIAGTAIHQPELFYGAPPWTGQVAFAGAGQLSGTATTAGAAGQEMRGTGSGSATVSDGAGVTCPGTSFAWTIHPA